MILVGSTRGLICNIRNYMKISNEIFIFTHTIYYTNDILFTYLYS